MLSIMNESFDTKIKKIKIKIRPKLTTIKSYFGFLLFYEIADT